MQSLACSTRGRGRSRDSSAACAAQRPHLGLALHLGAAGQRGPLHHLHQPLPQVRVQTGRRAGRCRTPGRPSSLCPLQGGGGGLPARPTAPPPAPYRGSAAARACRRPAAGAGAQPAGRTAPRPGRQPLAARQRQLAPALARARAPPPWRSRDRRGPSPRQRAGGGGASHRARALCALRPSINVPSSARFCPPASGSPLLRGLGSELGAGSRVAPLGAGGDAAGARAGSAPAELAGPGGGTGRSCGRRAAPREAESGGGRELWRQQRWRRQ